MVMDKVTDVMDCVMDESIGSDRCDGCDGKFKKSPEFRNSAENESECNTQQQSNSESNNDLEQSLIKNFQDECLPITVGDRVEINDCPAHWNWASPFTVEAIEGEMVKLYMVGELVDLSRLVVCKKVNC
jgi:putative DNA primase/helicase